MIKKSILNFPTSRKILSALKYHLVTLAILVVLTGCSIESKLTRNYKGRSFSEVMATMGAPTHIENLVGGGTLRTYEKKVMLKETPINTGHFQYDSFDSPKVLKTEVWQFTVDTEAVVRDIKYNCTFSK